MEIVFHKHNAIQYSIGASFFLMQNCQNGLAFANFTLKNTTRVLA